MATALASPRPKTAEEAAASGVQENTRLYFADHLRVALTALVVLHHLAITYGVAIGWYYQEVNTDPLVNGLSLAFVLFNQAYFMGLFFFLAAYFTPSAFTRKGARAYLKDRALRLGLPLLAYIFIIAPLASLGLYYTYLRDTLPYWQFYLFSGAGVAWFIEALLLFALGYALWRRFAGSQPAPQGTSAPPRLIAIIAFILGLALVSYLARIAFPVGYFVPWVNLQLGYFPQYIAMFLAGLVAYRRSWLQTLPTKAGIIGFSVSLIATLLFFPFAATAAEAASGGGRWQSLIYTLWDSTVCVGMTLALITFFRARFNTTGPVWRFLSAQAYTVYLIHPLILVAVGYALSGLAAHPFVKLALAAVLALPLCFGVAALIRRLPFARHIL